MALYADLRKTQAELDEQRRDQLVQGHTPRNYARMKTHDEPAAGAKPEDFLPSSPIRNMTTEQVIGFEKARGNWDDAKAETYRQAQAAAAARHSGPMRHGTTTRHPRSWLPVAGAHTGSRRLARFEDVRWKRSASAARSRPLRDSVHCHGHSGPCACRGPCPLPYSVSARLRFMKP